MLVGIDFSKGSRSALAQAVRLSRAHGARIRVVHVVDRGVVDELRDALSASGEDVRGGIVREVQRRWEEFRVVVEAGQTLQLEVELDHPTAAMVRLVKDTDAQLLLLGVHGTSAHGRGPGPVALACVRNAPASVLLVRDSQTGPFRSVVACTDFSPIARTALLQAAGIVQRDRAALHVLHVFRAPWHRLHYRAPTPHVTPEFQEQFRHALLGRLEEWTSATLGSERQLHVEHHLEDCESHGVGVVNFCRVRGPDLVALGTRGHTNLRDLLLGSTAERVVRDVACSTLVVKPESSDHPLAVSPKGLSEKSLRN
jgi:nucleotide-binding universal stress UspA family protein